jgi:hypothetical protein
MSSQKSVLVLLTSLALASLRLAVAAAAEPPRVAMPEKHRALLKERCVYVSSRPKVHPILRDPPIFANVVAYRAAVIAGGCWGQTNCRHNLELVDTRIYLGFSIEALPPLVTVGEG